MLENPTYFLRRKQTFHVRILVLTRLDGQLITLLSHFPALRGSLYLHIDTRVTPVTFFRYRQSSRSPKTQTNSALFWHMRWLRSRRRLTILLLQLQNEFWAHFRNLSFYIYSRLKLYFKIQSFSSEIRIQWSKTNYVVLNLR